MFLKPINNIIIVFLLLLSCSFLTPYEGEVELIVTGRNDTNGIVIECKLINNTKDIVEAPPLSYNRNRLVCQKPDSTFQDFLWIWACPLTPISIQQGDTMIWEYNLTERYIEDEYIFEELINVIGKYKIFWQFIHTKTASFVLIEKKEDETLVLIEQQEHY